MTHKLNDESSATIQMSDTPLSKSNPVSFRRSLTKPLRYLSDTVKSKLFESEEITPSLFQQTPEALPTVAIIGMGPGGLAAAIEAAKKGLKVIIIENRDYFTRPQRVHLDAVSFQFLESLRDNNNSEDTRFFEKQVFRSKKKDGTYSKDGIVQVKDVQAYLTRKLYAYDNVIMKRGKKTEVVVVDPNHQTLTLNNPDKEIIHFDYLLDASGARHAMANKLNEALSSKTKQIHYKPLEMQLRHASVGTVSLQLKKGVVKKDTAIDGNGKNFKIEHLPKLYSLGWNQPYFPKVRVFRNAESTKFFFSGEIPKSIQHIKNKEAQRKALAEWGKFIVSVEMSLSADDLELPSGPKRPATQLDGAINQTEYQKFIRSSEKDNLRTTAFTLELNAADKAAIPLGKKGAFVLVGDAFKNANFFFSHGMNDAILNGITAVNCIETANDNHFNFNIDKYESHQKNLVRILNYRLKSEADDPKINMPNIYRDIISNMTKLISLAKKMHNPQLKKNIHKMASMAQPGSKDFNPHLYTSQFENLSQAMQSTTEKKLASADRKKGLFFLNGKKAKYQKIQTEMTDAIPQVERELGKFFKTNSGDVPLIRI